MICLCIYLYIYLSIYHLNTAAATATKRGRRCDDGDDGDNYYGDADNKGEEDGGWVMMMTGLLWL